ncbi:hypothetical protein ACFOY4_38815 [Actinomadura syzygii]|uniref:Uncharacterized protein n=1 Tax=Actinomadura syzygii TaxID=1427538 RepID=A0A5D0U9L6_9ACTN|nr:hypothetical protein [Actinomadura syzygii]TYC14332.1 hypothetical protein FXF65_15820 [Actinomadura syzygii]
MPDGTAMAPRVNIVIIILETSALLGVLIGWLVTLLLDVPGAQGALIGIPAFWGIGGLFCGIVGLLRSSAEAKRSHGDYGRPPTRYHCGFEFRARCPCRAQPPWQYREWPVRDQTELVPKSQFNKAWWHGG